MNNHVTSVVGLLCCDCPQGKHENHATSVVELCGDGSLVHYK